MKRILFLACLLFAAKVHAADPFWVSTSGSDSNGCTRSASPLTTTAKRTIQGGINCQTTPGDLLYIRGGSYVPPTSHPASGSGGTFTTISNYNGEPVTVTGTWPPYYSSGAHRIKLSGTTTTGEPTFIIDNNHTSDEGLFVDNGSQLIIFEYVKVLNSRRQGVFFANGSPGFNELRGSWVYDNGTDQQLDHGVYVEGGNNLIEFNKIFRNRCYGIHQYNGAAQNASNNTYRFNELYSNRQGGGSGTCFNVILSSGTNNKFYNNIVRDGAANGAEGIQVKGSGQILWNNTVYNHSSVGIVLEGSGHTLKNTASTNSPTNIDNLSSASTLSNNYSGSTPGYVDAGSGNFNLTSSSALIAGGTSSIASGVTACGNGAVDIGAHQTIKVLQAEVGAINSTTVAINLQNNCTPSILPASAITGLTIQEDTGGGFASKTISGVTSTAGSNQVRAVVTAGFTGGSTARFSYSTSTGNITDSALIGGASNQRLNAVTDFTITNNVGGGGGISFAVVNLQAFEHSCGEVCTRALSSNLAKAGTFSIPLRGKFLLREGIKCLGGNCPVQAHAIWYTKNGGSAAQIPTQTTGQEDLSICPAPNVQNGQATTQQITTGTFVAGQVRTIGTGAPSVDLNTNEVTENVRSICVGPNVVATDSFGIQIRDAGGTAITNTAVATVTTQSPSRAKLEIGCEGMWAPTAAGQDCKPGAPGLQGDIEITMAPGLKPNFKRRTTDQSNAVHLEVPKSAAVRINGVIQ